MQPKKLTIAGRPADAGTDEAISAHPIDITPSPQLNSRMVQNVILIWLDQNTDENNPDCRNTIEQLRRVVHTINKFTDVDNCIQFLEEINEEKSLYDCFWITWTTYCTSST